MQVNCVCEDGFTCDNCEAVQPVNVFSHDEYEDIIRELDCGHDYE